MQIVDKNSGITSQLVADFVHQWYQTVMVSNCFTALTESCFKLNHDPPWKIHDPPWKFHLKEYRFAPFRVWGAVVWDSILDDPSHRFVPTGQMLEYQGVFDSFEVHFVNSQQQEKLTSNSKKWEPRSRKGKEHQHLLNTRGRMTFLATL